MEGEILRCRLAERSHDPPMPNTIRRSGSARAEVPDGKLGKLGMALIPDEERMVAALPAFDDAGATTSASSRSTRSTTAAASRCER